MAWLRSIAIMENGDIKKIEDLPDAYTEMLVNAASKVMNATQILQNFAVVFLLA